MTTDVPYSTLNYDHRRTLLRRVLDGEVFVLRGALQHSGLMELLEELTVRGMAKVVGRKTAEDVRAAGFERLHELVPVERVVEVTDAVFETQAAAISDVLQHLVPMTFPGAPTHYHEPSPHVRFHVPFHIARQHKKAFDEFAIRYGQGKLAAHGPHRDSWLDCPSNAVNLWCAIGPVRRGNGLTIFERDYRGPFRHQPSGEISLGERLHSPTTFELEPGDMIVFHGDQMHGSELNATNETRFVVSYRITFGRPVFPNGHYHPYFNSKLYRTPLKALSLVPASLQPSYAKSLVSRVGAKFGLAKPPNCQEGERAEVTGPEVDGAVELRLEDLGEGTIHAVSRSVCVARTGPDEVFAFSRRCPHKGADLAAGFVAEGHVVCPWHNLSIDPSTGKSACQGLAVRRFRADVRDGLVSIHPKQGLGREESASLAAEPPAPASAQIGASLLEALEPAPERLA